ncbi:MAG: lamin tail domain-containing protein [Myxococcales bacterium]|nr:lamin tail domain-containing protein [Myxococcales bacterium]MCB9526219.1 lamin tail domain-containing protein [Myxococcales bacterium]
MATIRPVICLVAALSLAACADADDRADRTARFGNGVFGEAPTPAPAAPEEPKGSPAPAPQAALPTRGQVVINEVAAKGDPVDWIELFNVDTHPVDLSGWTFVDDVTAEPPGAGTFPQGTVIQPGQFLQVEVSDEASGFKLAGDEELILFDADGQVADAVDWSDGDSPAGGSLARIPDGIGHFRPMARATPAAQNTGG